MCHSAKRALSVLIMMAILMGASYYITMEADVSNSIITLLFTLSAIATISAITDDIFIENLTHKIMYGLLFGLGMCIAYWLITDQMPSMSFTRTPMWYRF